MLRDDFPKNVRDDLAKRVRYQCSNPGCKIQTIGPKEGPEGSASFGVAAHITAAAPGGPRYDAELTTEQRKNQENGIHLCANCARHIDEDPRAFPTTLLKEWKRSAEEESSRNLRNQRVRDRKNAYTPSAQPAQVESVTIQGIGKFIRKTTASLGHSNIIYGSTASGKSLLCKILTNRTRFEQGEDESHLSVPNGSYTTICWSDSKPMEYKVEIYDDTPRTYINNAEVLAITLPYKIVELTRRLPRFVEESKELEVFAEYFGISSYEMTNVFRWLMETPQITHFEYSLKLLRKTQQILVRTDPTRPRTISISGLSSSEQARVLLDVAMALSQTNSTQSPTLLLIDMEETLPSLDPTNRKVAVDAIGRRKGTFQVILCTSNFEADWNLDGYTLTEIILHNPYRRNSIAEFVSRTALDVFREGNR